MGILDSATAMMGISEGQTKGKYLPFEPGMVPLQGNSETMKFAEDAFRATTISKQSKRNSAAVALRIQELADKAKIHQDLATETVSELQHILFALRLKQLRRISGNEDVGLEEAGKGLKKLMGKVGGGGGSNAENGSNPDDTGDASSGTNNSKLKKPSNLSALVTDCEKKFGGTEGLLSLYTSQSPEIAQNSSSLVALGLNPRRGKFYLQNRNEMKVAWGRIQKEFMGKVGGDANALFGADTRNMKLFLTPTEITRWKRAKQAAMNLGVFLMPKGVAGAPGTVKISRGSSRPTDADLSKCYTLTLALTRDLEEGMADVNGLGGVGVGGREAFL